MPDRVGALSPAREGRAIYLAGPSGPALFWGAAVGRMGGFPPCRLGVGFALAVGSLIDAELIEACPSPSMPSLFRSFDRVSLPPVARGVAGSELPWKIAFQGMMAQYRCALGVGGAAGAVVQTVA